MKRHVLGPMAMLAVALVLGVAGRARGQGAAALPNPGFEADPVTAGWETAVFGATPRIEADSSVVHAGARSLRVSAAEPSDTAFGREVALRPRQWYRFSGWVKTHDLQPGPGRVFGTLQAQNPGGAGVIASAPNHGGETEWTNTALFFQAPEDGKARLCLFFTGFGRGTGTVWFDDLKLEETNFASTPVVVTREPLVSGSIRQTQYGQFIEYLCDLVPSMWAEKLYDGGFEGLSPYKFVFLKETDFKEKAWHPSGEVNRATYTLDKETKVGGDVSRKIEVPSGPPCAAGIAQDGVFVERGKRCDFKIWLRGKSLAGPVRVTLRHEARVFTVCEFNPDGEWRKYQAILVSPETDANATLSIEFRGPGTLWLDNASLMPSDTAGGWRPEVLEAVRALRPGIIRFGGSTLDDPNLGEFEWKDTVGDPDLRKPFRAWGGLQPTGPGLEEIVQFCRRAGAEPLICVRFSGRAPADAAEEVAYFNGSTNTAMGAWRARNGHPEPYRIKYWQVGNERSGRDYEQRMAAFCAAMKEADPEIKLFSSYPTPAVIRSAGSMLDYVCPHHYTQDLGGAESDLLHVARMIRENAPGRGIKIAVTEWNTTGGDAGPRRAMLWTLANALACSRYQNLLHRHCDLVEIANRSNLANSFCSGIIQMDNHRLYKTPTYYAQELYATLGGTRPLRIDSTPPPNTGLDLSATLSAAGDELVLFAVNDSSAPARRRLDLSAFSRKGAALEVWTLRDRQSAGEPDATNSFAEPERVAPVRSRFKAGSPRFEYTFPALSLTVLQWKL